MDKRSQLRWCIQCGLATLDLLAVPLRLLYGAVLRRQRGEDPLPPDSVVLSGQEDDRVHLHRDAVLVRNHEVEVGLRRDGEDTADQARAPLDKLALGAREHFA